MATEPPGLLRLDEQLAHWAAARPEHQALVAPDGSLTFAQLYGNAQHLATQLSALGVRAGDVVAFQLPNIPDAFVLYHAVVGMDAVALPILPAMREHDLSYMLRESSASLFVTLASWRGFDHERLARRSCSVSTSIALIEPGTGLRLAGKGERALEQGEAPPPTPTAGGLDAICSMIFTSGTSGRSKAVLYSHRNLAVEGREMAAVERISADDVLFVPPSIAHVSGICFGLYMPMAAGSTVCLMPAWSPEAAVRMIEKERCTWTAGPTPFLQGIVDAAQQDASTVKSLRVFRCGGASVPPALVRRARARHRRLPLVRHVGAPDHQRAGRAVGR